MAELLERVRARCKLPQPGTHGEPALLIPIEEFFAGKLRREALRGGR